MCTKSKPACEYVEILVSAQVTKMVLHILDVFVHDADDLLDLGLLLGHLPCSLDLPHLLGSWDGLAVGAKGTFGLVPAASGGSCIRSGRWSRHVGSSICTQGIILFSVSCMDGLDA